MRVTLRSASPLRSVFFIFTLLLVLGLQSGCASRTVRSSIIERFGIRVDLVREVQGFTTQARGFQHPAVISVPRLRHILGAIEVETKGEAGGTVRQPAFHPAVLEPTAVALAEALAEAGPDHEIGVQVVRRKMSYGILHQKYLTSFLAYIENDHLYLTLSRVDWFVPKGLADDRIPKPRRGHRAMPFRVVGGEPLFYAGPQTLEIVWRDPVFKARYRLPGSTQGTKRRREVLLESPIPKQERDATDALGTDLSVEELSASQLRALADLEEDRQNGRITETAYQRAKRQLLRRR
jgi:hypothetical protein